MNLLHEGAAGAPSSPTDQEHGRDSSAFVVSLDGWEGPVDLLLALARTQKVDLRHISIVALADQYLAYVAAAQRGSLELAAEYLVMAAWLAELKSRLLLPQPANADEPSSEEVAAALTFQLRRLDAMREAGKRLMARPQLGRDFWARGSPEPVNANIQTVVTADLRGLLRAYARVLRQRQGEAPLALTQMEELDSVDAALGRILRSLGQVPSWESLTRYLPEGTLEGLRDGTIRARSSIAATFGAVLELARQGTVVVRQNQPFGPIFLKRGDGGSQ